MSKLSKIKQTKKAKLEYVHPIIEILANRCSKQNIMDVLHCTEREARDLVSECSMHYPVITYSTKGVGYRRAKDIEKLSDAELDAEIQEVNKAAAELLSRIKCLKKRLKPLIAWKKVAEKKLSLRRKNDESK